MPTKTITKKTRSAKRTARTRRAAPQRTEREIMEEAVFLALGYDPRITDYLFTDAEEKKMRLNPDFTPTLVAAHEVDQYMVQEIGSLGNKRDLRLRRIVRVHHNVNAKVADQ